LKWLIKTYDYNKQSEVLQSFLQNWPEHKTQQQIEDGKSEADIRELGNRSRKFKKMRAKYLIKKHQLFYLIIMAISSSFLLY
jgi:hypothetical protein